MTTHKIILALLAAVLVAIGTTTAVVHADEPDITDYMDQAAG